MAGILLRQSYRLLTGSNSGATGKSNSGEGGEDPVRWLKLEDIDEKGTSKALPHLKGLEPGDTATSRIKQVRAHRRLGAASSSSSIQLHLADGPCSTEIAGWQPGKAWNVLARAIHKRCPIQPGGLTNHDLWCAGRFRPVWCDA